jgi:hypothetical protein
MTNIDRCCQLHEVIEIHYFVSVWEAQLYTQEGNRLVITAEGSSVASAIDHLNRKLHGVSLDQLRAMPALTGMKSNMAIRRL